MTEEREQPEFRARAICACGSTDLPHRSYDIGSLSASAREWVTTMGFARAAGDELTCPVCKSDLRIAVRRA